MIKEYAISNSTIELARVLNKRGFTINSRPIERSDVLQALSTKTKEELRKILRSAYLHRINAVKKGRA